MSAPLTGTPGAPRVPDKPSLDGLEQRWSAVWEEAGTYRFDPSATRAEVFSIDTPPPTVSGSLHMGSVFGYVQTDAIARYRRMRGWKLFYPMGWDDNGLPTERRVQTYYGVTCDPSLAYDSDFSPPEEPGREDVGVSRPNFIALCHELTAQDEQAFEDLWRRVGLSVDWTRTYATIDDTARRTSQRMFLHNLARGEAYTSEAPTMWDVDYQTAVAQAEMEDKEQRGAYHRLRFDDIEIETTRPELVAACVALVAHPDDERYTSRFGTSVHTPLFGVEVPVLAHRLAEPDKGTGIAMICTFGDITDVVWWRELDLPTRSIITRTGRITETPPAGVPDNEAWRAIAGKTVKQAQRATVELLAASGEMVGEPRPVTHPVKFYERGDRPLEIVTSRQWFIRNGGRDDALRRRLLERATELDWHPPYMKVRFDDWVNGLNGDWLISRQRFFGVPIPVWYPLGPDGDPDHDRPIVPDEARLPVDPTTDVPEGYTADQRGVPGGFTGDPDVMDTWATSSVTPQIACGWVDDPALFAATFPMDLRPQGPEIIRTWLFSTLLRSHLEHDTVPWRHTTINGWILDPDRKKMSKSKGNVVTPVALLDEFGSDAVRYWACNGRPGTDTALDMGVMKIGRRLAIKVLNASKFALGRLGEGPVPGIDAVHDAARHGTAGPAGPAGRGDHGGARRLRLRPGARADRGLLLVLLRRLRRAGEDPRLRRGLGHGRRLGPGHPGRRPVRPAPPLRTVPALRHRGGLELVAGGIGARGAVAHRRRDRPARRCPARRAGRGRRRAERRAAREDGAQAVDAGAGGHADRDRPAGRARRRRGRPRRHRRRGRGRQPGDRRGRRALGEGGVGRRGLTHKSRRSDSGLRLHVGKIPRGGRDVHRLGRLGGRGGEAGRVEEVAHARCGGLATQRGQDVKGMLGQR